MVKEIDIMKFKVTILAVMAILISTVSFAREYQGGFKRSGGGSGDATAANCVPPVNSNELSINNVRALIQTGGDMWWDLVGVPRYEVPKGSGRTALFAGSLWLGGRDASGQLKVAALRFRQRGMDFWTGPLNTVTAEIDPTTCDQWDVHFKSTRQEVDAFVQKESIPNYVTPEFIKTWPAHGDPSKGEDTYLAPFIDVDGDGFYNYENGDYPGYDLSGKVDCQGQLLNVYGDENLWWIFNDKGNIHTETGGQSIGMEIRAQAFAFATNDEVNNMTFYNYELVNRSSFDLRDTYFGFWVDADLGNAQDDYVGCDVERGLGFAYNGDEFDDDNAGRPGYGENPPAIGVDFFQGPFQDSDGKDNCLCDNYADAIADGGIVYNGSGVGYGDGKPDNERLGMRAFLYHINNQDPRVGDPTVASDYYNFLRSVWKDNSDMVYGGTGHRNSPGAVQPLVEANYMFPGDSDPKGWGTGGDIQAPWTEVSAGNVPQDRRFVQSAGPFSLAPGAVNNITVGVVWARATSGGAAASVQAMKQADTKTQALFDNCFQLLDGPDAPVVAIRELDKQLVFQLDNVSGNNKNDDYFEVDPFIVPPSDSIQDENGDWITKVGNPILFDSLVTEYKSYRFQGYQVYQVKDGTVSAADLYNEDLAKLVFQCDIKDGVERLINYRFDLDLQAVVPELRVNNAANDGVYKTFTLGDDLFALGDRKMVNYRTYYYMAIAYAHNDYKTYSQTVDGLDGQKTPYLPSRKAPTGPIIRYSAIPHKTEMQNGGQVLNSKYGDYVLVVRTEGIGNNGHFLEMDQASIDEAMSGAPYKVANPTYVPGNVTGATSTPIAVKVIDPLQVKAGDYTIMYKDSNNSGLANSYWILFGGALGTDTIKSKSTISGQKEELIPQLGISITIKDVKNAWYDKFNNGFIGSRTVYEDNNKQWLTGVPSLDGATYQNWIRSGLNAETGQEAYFDYDMTISSNGNRDNARSLDPEEVYERVLSGTWTPFRMAAWNIHAPGATRGGTTDAQKSSLFKEMFRGLPLSGPEANAGYQLAYLNSVDIVFTSDKAKWTRCVVVEMQDDATLSEGNAAKLDPRSAASVDKAGLSAGEAGYNAAEGDLISTTGMGWFPGYAIDIETGERLNMAFGEDSYIVSENGNDMMWNPTDKITEGQTSNSIRFGGKHYVFVFRNNDVEEQLHQVPLDYNDPENRMPSYDEGTFMHAKLALGDKANFYHVYRSAMWVGLPLLQFNQQLLSNKAVIQLRVNKQHALYSSGEKLSIGQTLEKDVEYLVEKGPVKYNSKEYVRGQNIVGVDNTSSLQVTSSTGTDILNNVTKTVNGGRPTYKFSLTGLEAKTNVSEVVSNALGKIRIVPNPYYAYSEYEQDKNDFKVRVTNLPAKCKVRIYTLNGVLVREFTKDDDSITYLEWDLKNHARIPVASGMYIVHVEVPGVGETILKWFGAMRPVDLDSF
jgi:hypothetical protein